MPEVYDCICKNTTWTIMCDEIMCSRCDRRYKINVAIHPNEFNKNPERFLVGATKEG